MAEDDGGMLLNISYTPKASVKPKSKASKANVKLTEPKSETQHQTKSTDNRHLKGKFIPSSQFTPVSSLFRKNPDIPSHELQVVVPGRVDEDLFSADTFDKLPIHKHLASNLSKNMSFDNLTKVQKMSMPAVINRRDCMIKSVTGSGKTLCYAVPIVDYLMKIEPRCHRSDGPYAVVLLPTRELALQTFDVIQDLCKSCIWVIPGILVGGDSCKSEKARLRKGLNIIVATPGRLLYHVEVTSSLDLSRVSFLVLDEADRLLDMGFEKKVFSVISAIKERSCVELQSILLSATLNPNVNNLASVCLKEPQFIDATLSNSEFESETPPKQDEFVVPASLKQYFVVVPAKLRLVTLISLLVESFLEERRSQKLIVFSATKHSVEFTYAVLKDIVCPYIKSTCKGVSDSLSKTLYKLHGDMTQEERLQMFTKFKKCNSGILFCTDVAARGLDLPAVDFIIQYTCPTEIEDYLHRVGRTARIGADGKALLFLLPSETNYKNLLDTHNVALESMDVTVILQALVAKKNMKRVQHYVEEAATSLQREVEEKVKASDSLKKLSVSAYKSFIKGYATYPSSLKHIFHVRFLHLGHVAKSFGLQDAPQKIAGETSSNADSRKKRKIKVSKSGINKKMKLDEEQYVPDQILSGPRPGRDKSVIDKSSSSNHIKRKKKQKTKI